MPASWQLFGLLGPFATGTNPHQEKAGTLVSFNPCLATISAAWPADGIGRASPDRSQVSFAGVAGLQHG